MNVRTVIRTCCSVIVAAAAFFVMTAGQVVMACPSCSNDIAQNQGLADGIGYSILGMMSFPTILFFAVAGYIYRAYYRRRYVAGVDPDFDRG